MTTLRRTPLYAAHEAAKAKIVPFAGWEMPIEYSGILAEHAAVRSAMGLFDVSHMGEIDVRGRRAEEFCQKIATNDASSLKAGKVHYSAILNEQGGILDDCTLYRLAEDHFMFVVNASRKEVILPWLKEHAMEGVKIEDRSDEFALLALQGPKAPEFLSHLVRRDLSTVKYYEFTLGEIAGVASLISRTGYTGEEGFEIYLPWEKAAEVWDILIHEGAKEGLVPIGLGARDTLRLEMGYLLYGNDMNDQTTPLEAGLGWIVKLEKGAFIGRERLMEQKEKGLQRRIRGLKVTGKGIPRPHYAVEQNGQRVGEVTSGTFSPSLKVGIALAYLPPKVTEGNEVSVIVRDRGVSSVVTKPPFVETSLKK